MALKLGRGARVRRPHVPHMSALLAGKVLPPPPPSCDWSKGMPADLGMMLNDTLGDCTCAAVYHAMQVWSFNALQNMVTEPNSDVLLLYEQACGYNPLLGGEGPGGVEQDLLTYWATKGVPITVLGEGRNLLAAFVEVDPRNTDDVKRTILECGLAYIGFEVPAYLMTTVGGKPGYIWDLPAAGQDTSIEGGHAVILVGYDAEGLTAVSWGALYRMTWGFFNRYVDEVYALADEEWIETSGSSPAGMSLAELKAQMQALRA